ncbi:septum formation inhibitor Maf [Rheinheimera riviphila]|uniref:7-methyl-GTP pyrophosphatase n=1 Tax=Rheinheimera riviphila TaxID=1834037 RepID=A0A437R299_9GAMM|nr:Maf family protein [Rheinheimera riviphila]RVU40914.1 septum formation inhibitor Maf [Rheinheimera riviphila]
MPANLWLASTSVYRKALLEKLTPNFETAKPEVDETALPGESAQQLVERLAIAKAQAVAASVTDGLVIGSDQVAMFEGDILGKPHTADNAFIQLRRFSGHKVTFLTGLAVVNAKSGAVVHCVDTFHVHFRQLSDLDIQTYISREQPLNCAGSFKSEGLGITLFEKLEGDDPNSLIGLPLIKLHQLLKQQGRDLLLQP